MKEKRLHIVHNEVCTGKEIARACLSVSWDGRDTAYRQWDEGCYENNNKKRYMFWPCND